LKEQSFIFGAVVLPPHSDQKVFNFHLREVQQNSKEKREFFFFGYDFFFFFF
jgi:hypothetical protein